MDRAEARRRWQQLIRRWRRELRAYPRDHPAFLAPELRNTSGAPYWLRSERPSPLGVLLVHGFLSSPEELKPLARRLAVNGYSCLGVRLAGHGSSPLALAQTRADDWLDSVEHAYALLSQEVPRIVVLGFSTGGLLSLYLAARRPPGLQGVISICAPVGFVDRSMELVPFLETGRRLWQGLSGRQTPVFRLSYPEYPRINYRNMPLPALAGLQQLVGRYQLELAKVTAPVCLLQSRGDPVVSPESATLLAQALPQDAEVVWAESQVHNLLRNDPQRWSRWVLQRLARWRAIVPAI